MSRHPPKPPVPWHKQSYRCQDCGCLLMLVQYGTRVLEVNLTTPTYQLTEERSAQALVLVRKVGDVWGEHRCGGG